MGVSLAAVFLLQTAVTTDPPKAPADLVADAVSVERQSWAPFANLPAGLGLTPNPSIVSEFEVVLDVTNAGTNPYEVDPEEWVAVFHPKGSNDADSVHDADHPGSVEAIVLQPGQSARLEFSFTHFGDVPLNLTAVKFRGQTLVAAGALGPASGG